MSSHKPSDPSVQQMIADTQGKGMKRLIEKLMPILLFTAATLSVLTTFAIVFTLIFETFEFFQRVSITDYLFGTEWLPFSSKEPMFGILIFRNSR